MPVRALDGVLARKWEIVEAAVDDPRILKRIVASVLPR